MAEHSFPNEKELLATADSIWWGLDRADWEEAFAARLPMRGRTQIAGATAEMLEQIAVHSELYEERFNMPLVAMTTGRTAAQILRSLEMRLQREPDVELKTNADQQLKITHIRLRRLLSRH